MAIPDINKIGDQISLVKAACTTPVDGWYLALRWALNLDEESVRRQRETILSRTRANLLKRRAEPCED